MMGTGYFLKSQKLIPASPNKFPQNTKNRQPAKRTPAKLSCRAVSIGKMIGRLINHVTCWHKYH